jgi:acetyl esterase
MMDPELAAASALMERPDVSDEASARELLKSIRDPSSSADDDTAGRVRITQMSIEVGKRSIPLRVYAPTGAATTSPAVVFFHGGAFILGDLDTEHHRCLRYAADGGCVVISVDYRLAPEHPFPAGVDDCYQALVWAAEHAEDLGVDSNRIAVAGSSAGGALAAAVALMARDRTGPQVALQILLYPVLDDRMRTHSMHQFVDTPVWDQANNAAMWAQYLATDEEAGPYAAPARAESLNGLPPAYVMTAELDPLRDEAIEYALRMLRDGVSVELRQVAGAYHGFDDMVPDATISRRAIADQVYHLKQVLRS